MRYSAAETHPPHGVEPSPSRAAAGDQCAHLAQVSRYIHRNPVEAGLAATPWQWPWSSAQAYMGLARVPDWLHTDAIIEMFGPRDARQKYREFLGEKPNADVRAGCAEWQGVPWGQTRRV